MKKLIFLLLFIHISIISKSQDIINCGDESPMECGNCPEELLNNFVDEPWLDYNYNYITNQDNLYNYAVCCLNGSLYETFPNNDTLYWHYIPNLFEQSENIDLSSYAGNIIDLQISLHTYNYEYLNNGLNNATDDVGLQSYLEIINLNINGCELNNLNSTLSAPQVFINNYTFSNDNTNSQLSGNIEGSWSDVDTTYYNFEWANNQNENLYLSTSCIGYPREMTITTRILINLSDEFICNNTDSNIILNFNYADGYGPVGYIQEDSIVNNELVKWSVSIKNCSENIIGCSDQLACNYTPLVTIESECDYTCQYGCMNTQACNYDPSFLYDNGSCEFEECGVYEIYGCTDENSCNYDVYANTDNGLCGVLDDCDVCQLPYCFDFLDNEVYWTLENECDTSSGTWVSNDCSENLFCVSSDLNPFWNSDCLPQIYSVNPNTVPQPNQDTTLSLMISGNHFNNLGEWEFDNGQAEVEDFLIHFVLNNNDFNLPDYIMSFTNYAIQFTDITDYNWNYSNSDNEMNELIANWFNSNLLNWWLTFSNENPTIWDMKQWTNVNFEIGDSINFAEIISGIGMYDFQYMMESGSDNNGQRIIQADPSLVSNNIIYGTIEIDNDVIPGTYHTFICEELDDFNYGWSYWTSGPMDCHVLENSFEIVSNSQSIELEESVCTDPGICNFNQQAFNLGIDNNESVCGLEDICNTCHEPFCFNPISLESLYIPIEECNFVWVNSDCDNNFWCLADSSINPDWNSCLDNNTGFAGGCTVSFACNFNPEATFDDDSCFYPQEICEEDLENEGIYFDSYYWAFYNCDCECLNDLDNDSICDQWDDCIGSIDNCGVCNGNNLCGDDNLVENEEDPQDEEDDENLFFNNPWAEPLYVTDCNATLGITTESTVLVDGEPVSVGDWIGVFYTDLDGQLACGGSAIWTGESTSIVIWGDDTTTDNIKEGFSNDEELIWMIWDNESNVIMDNIEVEYSLGSNSFYCNSLIIASTIISTPTIIQQINLPQGWFIWSTYIQPEHTSMDSIFSEIIDNVIIVKDYEGNVFWPELGINSIGNLNQGQGYYIKTNNADTLFVKGVQIDHNYSIDIPLGWFIASYIHLEPANVVDMMTSIESNLIIIKDYLGNVYWPEIGVNSIENLIPGYGYYLKTSDLSILNYPNIENGRLSYENSSFLPFQNTRPKNTGNNMTLAIPNETWTNKPNLGDEIIVFDQNNLIVGLGLYLDNHSVVTIWGNDKLTLEKDGMNTGEEFIIKLLRKDQNTKEIIKIEKWKEGSGTYQINGISIAEIINQEPIHDKKLLYITDEIGRITNINTNQSVLIYIYDDGSIERKYNLK